MSTQTTTAPTPKVRWIEPSALAGIWTREFSLYRRYWRSTTFSAIVEPLVYLFAFGFGFGTLISFIGDVPYIQFLGTGIVATAVLFTSVFAGMFTTFVRRKYYGTYDALLATPVDVHEIVLGEGLWIATKAAVYGCTPLLAAMLFGLEPSWGMLLVPFIAFITGLGFALFGILASAIVPSIDTFSYITSAVITPLFVISGTFFPLDEAPQWAQALSQVNPLYHCVELVRDAVFGLEPLADLWHLVALLIFVALMATLAIRFQRRRLIL